MTETLTFQPFQVRALAVMPLMTPFGSPVMAPLQPVLLDAPDFKLVLKNTLDRLDQL